MIDQLIRILYIDDYPLDRALVRDALQSDEGEFELIEASSRQEFDALLLAEQYDLVLSDFNILGFTGLQVLDAVQEQLPGTPVIIVTGTGSEEVAAEAIKRGAADYVIKTPSHIRRLPHIIKSALEAKHLRSQRIDAEQALRESEARNRAIVSAMPDLLFRIDAQTRFVDCEASNPEILLAPADEFLGKRAGQVLPSHLAELTEEKVNQTLSNGEIQVYEYSLELSAEERFFESRMVVSGEDEVLSIVRDITERKRIEQRLMAQRRDYETIIDAIPDMILYFDPGGRILRANTTAARVVGLPIEKLIGKTFFDIFPSHMAEEFQNQNLEVYQSKKPNLGVVEQFQSATGEIRWGSADRLPYLDPGGSILGVITIIQDVTDSKLAQEALLASESRYRMVSEITSDYAYGYKVQPDGELVNEWVTGALERITGYSQLELSEQEGWQSLMYPDDIPITTDQYHALMRGESKTVEYRIVTKSGETLWMEDQAQAIWDKNESRTTYIYGAVRDITERKRAEQARVRSQQLLLALSQAGQTVQRTLVPQKIYQTIGEEIRKLGYEAGVGIVSEDQQYIEVVYLSISTKVLNAAKKLTGLSPQGYKFRIPPGGFFRILLDGGKAVLRELSGETVTESLPEIAKPLAGKLAKELGLKKCIFAPLVLGGEANGLLAVLGEDLALSDVAGIEVFANQASIALQNARAAEALRKSEETYRTLFEGANDGIFILDLDGVHLGANKKATDMLGFELDELIGMGFHQVISPTEVEEAKSVLGKLQTGQGVSTYQRQFLRKNGESFPGEVNISLVYDDQGNPSYIQSIVRDISERVQAQEAIQRRTQQLESLREVGLDIAAQLDADQLLSKIIEHAMELLGGEAGGVYLYRNKADLLEWVVSIGEGCAPLGTTLKRGEGLSGRVWQTGEPLLVESYKEWEGKSPKWTHRDQCVIGVPIQWSQEFLGVINIRAREAGPFFTQEDIYLLMQLSTQAAIALKNAQAAEALRNRTEELRSLTMRLAETEQAERRHLARELHDQVGQSLAVLGFNLNIIRDQIAQSSAFDDLSSVDDSISLVDEVTHNIRGVMDDLRPSVLDDYGLFSALSWYGDRFFDQTGIETRVLGKSIEPRLAERIENALYRITQEALTNVTRHANANQVTISLTEIQDNIELQIKDDGSGFEELVLPEGGRRRGWGLVNMRERAEAIGGKFGVETILKQGTTIKVVAPIR